MTHPAWRDIGASVTCQCKHCWFATLTCLERTNRRNSRNAMNNSVKRTAMNNWHDFCLLIFWNKSFDAFSPCHFVPKTCLGHHTGLREWWPRRVVLDWFHSRMDVLWHTVEDEKSITAHPKVSHKRQQATKEASTQATKEASTTCLVFYLAFSGILNMSANPEHPFHVACGNNKMLRDDPKEKGTPLDFGKQPSI